MCSGPRPRILTPRVADKKRYKRHVAFATLRRNGRPRPRTLFFTLVLSTFLLHSPPWVQPRSLMVAHASPDASRCLPGASQMPPNASQHCLGSLARVMTLMCWAITLMFRVITLMTLASEPKQCLVHLEASGRHLGGIWRHLGRHGRPWATMGDQGG